MLIAAPADPRHLVSAKVRPPRPDADELVRTSLLSRLAANDRPIVLVRAGAGYGKTTLVRQWVEADARPVAWVTLGPGEDDPVVLLRYLARALDAIEPLTDVSAALMGPSRRQARAAAARLGSALASGRMPFVLVLDDIHAVCSAEAWAAIEVVLDSVPSGSHVVLVGRSAPRVHLSRRLLDGRVFELDQHDLTFTGHESQAVVRRLAPQLGEAEAAALIEWTESWPAGLRLATMALRHRHDGMPSLA